jgi:preprotein translocase subunit SecE
MASLNQYLHEVMAEVKKVTWPTRQQTIQMTGLVLTVSVIVALYLGTLDFLAQGLLRILITK